MDLGYSTELSSQFWTDALENTMNLLLFVAPTMALSGQELLDIENAWTGQRNANGLKSPDDLFLFSCRAAYTLNKDSTLAQDLYIIAVERATLRLLVDKALELTGDSQESCDYCKALLRIFKLPQPGQCIRTIQQLQEFSIPQNIELASTYSSLECIIEDEGQEPWKKETPGMQWFVDLQRDLRKVNFVFEPILHFSIRVDW